MSLLPEYSVIPLVLQLVVPLNVPPPPRLLLQVTWVTPTLSEAVPPIVRLLLDVVYVLALVGLVMLMLGDVVSVTPGKTVNGIAPYAPHCPFTCRRASIE
jgi:hypothetical protein